MPDVFGQEFELTTLLKVTELDLRGMAVRNQELTVGDYFFSLSKFLNTVPKSVEAMKRIADGSGEDNDLYSLTGFKTLLEEVGSKKIIQIFNNIIGAINRGDQDFATACIRSVLDDINKLYAKINAAEKSNVLTSVYNPSEASNLIETILYTLQPIIKVLEKLDREEATRKMKILAVDDSAVMLKTIISVLSSDYRVYGMTDPTMIEKFLGQITPELFLLDYQMPVRSGFELIPVIRSFEEHKKTPIIFLSSLGTIDHISVSHSFGACDFIVKPFQPDVLLDRVARYIRKKTF